MKFTRKVLLTLLAIIALTFSTLTFTAPAAHAGAHSCTGYGPGSIPKIGYAGWLCSNLRGEGLYTKNINTSFTGGVRLCNTEISWRFMDLKGKAYRTKSTGVKEGCRFREAPITWETDFLAKPGRVCAYLKASGEHQTATCYQISK